MGGQSGINTTYALGGQYTDQWTPGVDVDGSYFFNRTDSHRDQLTNRQYFLAADTSQFYRQANQSEATNYNHRANMRIECTLDSANEVIFTPRISFQSNSSFNHSADHNWLQDKSPISQSATATHTAVDGYTGSGTVVYRHKFATRGRTLSLQSSLNLNDRQSNRDLRSSTEYYSVSLATADSLDQRARTETSGSSRSANLAYTEPIGLKGQARLNYELSSSNNSTDKKSFAFDTLTGQYDLYDPAMSNIVNSGYLTHHADVGYQFRGSTFSTTLGLGFQSASLSADRTFPRNAATDKTFRNLMPAVTLQWGVSRRNNIQLMYRTSTNPPSITQLENTVNNNNPLLLSAGNPDLRQYYTQSLTIRYTKTDPESMASFFLLLSGTLTQDYIGSSLILASSDSLLEGGVILKQGAQLSQPANLGTQRTMRVLGTYSLPVKPIRCNLNLNTGASYRGTPALVNYARNRANTYTITQGLNLTSNLSADLDFVLAYDASFNEQRNSAQSRNTHYLSQVASLKCNWVVWKGFTLRTDANNQLFKRSQVGYSRAYTLWNLSIGKRFLAGNRGEISLQGYDLLNQNNNVNQSVAESYIQDQQTNSLNRYLLLTFSYRLSSFPERPRGRNTPTGSEEPFRQGRRRD